MILYHGQILPNDQQDKIINGLKFDLLNTLKQPNPITIEKVINACDRLAQKVFRGDYDEFIKPLLKELDYSESEFLHAAQLFTKQALTYKCEVELGRLEPLSEHIKRIRSPLGVLFHIAAGNVDGLPAYSVLEGLLVGNINLLKLPAGDAGFSIFILSELIQIEPDLKDYIYVFDVPSTELDSLKRLASLADGVVVWGGDVAVQAAKDMVDIQTKVIAWGHKLSFAYASMDATDDQLEGLATHICETNQLLCSSCQGIFIDAESKEDLHQFTHRFFDIFKTVNKAFKPVPYDMRAKNAIHLYNEQLEQHVTNHILLSDEGCSVIGKEDSKLELSYLFRNVWIKRLPQTHIIDILKPHKNHLQTVGLCVNEQTKQEVSLVFARAGLVRITSGRDMSRTIQGEAHDGTYPLREYSRIVEIDQ